MQQLYRLREAGGVCWLQRWQGARKRGARQHTRAQEHEAGPRGGTWTGRGKDSKSKEARRQEGGKEHDWQKPRVRAGQACPDEGPAECGQGMKHRPGCTEPRRTGSGQKMGRKGRRRGRHGGVCCYHDSCLAAAGAWACLGAPWSGGWAGRATISRARRPGSLGGPSCRYHRLQGGGGGW